MRLRFRVTALLWITAIVAVFFLGRRSEEIEAGFQRWWQVTRVRFGGDVQKGHRVVMWPRGSATINEGSTITKVSTDDPRVCTVTHVSDRQLRITPAANGQTTVRYGMPGLPKPCRFLVIVEDGRIADWTLTGSLPPRAKTD
jgi:hypothetical protein